MSRENEGANVIRRHGLSSFALKVIAIMGMTCNHGAYILYDHLPFPALLVMFAVGGVTFPIMAFLLVEGYKHTSSVRRYATRLGVFALVAQVPFWLFLAHEGNVLITLLLSLAGLWLYDHLERRGLFWLAFIGIVAASALCDWGVLGPVMVLMMHALPSRRERVAAPIGLAMASAGVPELLDTLATMDVLKLPFALYGLLGCGLAIPLTLAYDGRRGLPLKWAFYVYYPAHITLLWLVGGLVWGDWSLVA